MSRKWNFCAGPAALPQEVLEQAQAEILDWRGRGLSVMEMSHRGADFVSIAEEAEHAIRSHCPGARDVRINVVFDPPWTPERMSEQVRQRFGW